MPRTRYYSTEEAAQILGRAVKTLWTWHQTGRAKATRMGRDLRWAEEELDRLQSVGLRPARPRKVRRAA